tara:strand:+ start:539 stop:781 length:243 start_codon:yes stop_codon:yes gene_type:complete
MKTLDKLDIKVFNHLWETDKIDKKKVAQKWFSEYGIRSMISPNKKSLFVWVNDQLIHVSNDEINYRADLYRREFINGEKL